MWKRCDGQENDKCAKHCYAGRYATGRTEADDGQLAANELRDRIDRLHPEAWAWTCVCCRGNEDDALDVLQEVYVSVLEGRLSFGGRSSFKTWLFGVLRRTAGGRRSKFLRRFALLERWGRERDDEGQPDPAQGLQSEERGERVRAALEHLTARQREVVELAFYHDLSLSEVAEVLGISLGSVKTHYDRGKKELRRLLTGEF